MRGRLWTKRDDAKLRAAWPPADLAALAGRLGRTAESVKWRATVLGLRGRRAAFWTEADERVLERAWGYKPLRSIARALGRSPNALVQHARLLGLGACTRGRLSLLAFERETGYQRDRVASAARYIGLELPRSACAGAPGRRGRARRFALDIDHQFALLKLLRSWPDLTPIKGKAPGAGPDTCPGCLERPRGHQPGGLCLECRREAYRAVA